MKKKLLTMLLAGCMVLSLAACGSKEAENQTEEAVTEESAEESAIGTSKIVELGEYKGLAYTPVDATVTDEEVEYEVQYLLSVSSTKESQEVCGEDSVVMLQS